MNQTNSEQGLKGNIHNEGNSHVPVMTLTKLRLYLCALTSKSQEKETPSVLHW